MLVTPKLYVIYIHNISVYIYLKICIALLEDALSHHGILALLIEAMAPWQLCIFHYFRTKCLKGWCLSMLHLFFDDIVLTCSLLAVNNAMLFCKWSTVCWRLTKTYGVLFLILVKQLALHFIYKTCVEGSRPFANRLKPVLAIIYWFLFRNMFSFYHYI